MDTLIILTVFAISLTLVVAILTYYEVRDLKINMEIDRERMARIDTVVREIHRNQKAINTSA